MVGQKNFIKMNNKPLPPLEELKEFLDYNPDTGIFTWIKKPNNRIKIGKVAGHLHESGYIKIVFKRSSYRVNRLAYYMYHGVDPLEKLVDHIDGNKINNKIKNLRLLNTSQNAMNRVNLSSNNTSGVTGVIWCKRARKWVVLIMVNRVQKNMGYFINKEDAIKARKEAEIKYFGDFRCKV